MARGLTDGGARRGPYTALVVIGLVAWGAILLAPDAVFWDDWVVLGPDGQGMYNDNGLPWMGWINGVLVLAGPWAFTLVSLLATLAVGLLAWEITGRGLQLRPFERVTIAALVMVLPFNSAKVASAVLDTYTLSLGLFFVGWYLLVRRTDAALTPSTVIATLALFCSFTTASLLPFVALPVGHLLFLTIERDRGLVPAALRWAGRYWFVLVAPIAYWLIKTVFFKPSGLYAKYNSFVSPGIPRTLNELLLAGAFAVLLAALVVGVVSVVRPRAAASRGFAILAFGVAAGATLLVAIGFVVTRGAATPIALGLAVVFAACALLYMVQAIRGGPDTAFVLLAALVGLVALALGALPYLLVGKVPSWVEWDSRHQMLLAVGTAIVIVAALRALAGVGGARVARVAGVVIVVAATSAALVLSLTYVADWHKQSQVIRSLAASEEVEAADTVVFVDDAADFNAVDRTYRYYEYNGWLSTAFGDHTRLGLDASGVDGYLEGDLVRVLPLADRYGFGGFTVTEAVVRVRVTPIAGATWLDLLLDRPAVRTEVERVPDLESLR